MLRVGTGNVGSMNAGKGRELTQPKGERLLVYKRPSGRQV